MLASGMLSASCDDLSLPKPAAATGDGGNQPAPSTLAPPGAIAGGSADLFGSTLSSWAVLDETTGKLKEVGWSLPLAGVNAIPASTSVDLRWVVPLPPVVSVQTPIVGLTYDYLPAGHAPPGVYDTPHWEWHVHVIPLPDLEAIDCTDPTPPPDALLPKDFTFVPPPQNCTAKMGVHAYWVYSPEFLGERFTKTHSLSYYKGKLASLEPKMTRELLNRRETFTLEVPLVKKLAPGTVWPTKFTARYDATFDAYAVTYTDFTAITDSDGGT